LVVTYVPFQTDVVDSTLRAIDDGVPWLPIFLEHLRDKVQLMLVEEFFSVCFDHVICGKERSVVSKTGKGKMITGMGIKHLINTSLTEQHFGPLQKLDVVHRHVGKRGHMPLFPVLFERVGRLGSVVIV